MHRRREKIIDRERKKKKPPIDIGEKIDGSLETKENVGS